MPPLTRRDLLTTTAAALAAAPLLGPRALAAPVISAPTAPAPAAAAAPRAIKKAVKLGMVHDGATLHDKLALLAELGFDGVEVDSPSELDLDALRAAARATGVAVHGVVDSAHWRDTLGDPDPAVRARGVAALRTALRDAHALGADTVLLVPAVVDARVAYDQAYARSQDEIHGVLPLCEELRVAIAIENVWNGFLLSPLEAARYVDELASPWVGWYLDVGNLVNFGWPEQWVAILGPRILKLDVKEYSRRRRDEAGPWAGFDVPLLEGDCGWPAVLAALDAIGYRGWATAELPGGDAEWLRDVAQRMDRILAL